MQLHTLKAEFCQIQDDICTKNPIVELLLNELGRRSSMLAAFKID